jgi:hypothetical protein
MKGRKKGKKRRRKNQMASAGVSAKDWEKNHSGRSRRRR